MKRKIIRIFLGAALTIVALTALALTASAEILTGNCGDQSDNVTCTFDTSTGVLNISGTGDMAHFFFADVPWDSYRSSITKIKISYGVTNVGDFAFRSCINLRNVEISGSVTRIGCLAFERCSSLTSITIPDSVTCIGECAFDDSGYYNNASNWSDGVLYIGKHLIKAASSLSGSYTIKNGTLTIADYAFVNKSDSFTSIAIPDSVTSIGSNAFYMCSQLESVAIGDSVTSIGSEAFCGCSSLTSIAIPDSVTSIGFEAFKSCGSLASITFKTKNATISTRTFDGCPNLKTIYCYKNSTADKYFSSDEYTKIYLDDSICSLNELTDLDYLAMSSLSYLDWNPLVHEFGCSIKVFLSDRWNNTWEETEFKYSQMFENISNWTIHQVYENTKSGFACYVLKNEHDEYVIAYRGSTELSIGALLLDPDWLPNDIYMILGGEGEQISEALEVYRKIQEKTNENKIAVTGHSLGGGLADIVAAYGNCRGASFNSAPFLDIAYGYHAEEMAKKFGGIDTLFTTTNGNYKYQAHVIVGDFVGDFPESIKSKIWHNQIIHGNNQKHNLSSFVKASYDGSPTVSFPTEYRYFKQFVTQIVSSFKKIILATISGDRINVFLYPHENIIHESIIYGGNGNDTITDSITSSYIVGGLGYDVIDGGAGNDKYLYRKGDGKDIIFDSSGKDYLYLRDFDAADIIVVSAEGDSEYIEISCNDEVIISIYKDRSWLSQDFYLECSIPFYVGDERYDSTVGLNEYMKEKKYTKSYTISCPVKIEILDSENNVVYELSDAAPGNYYTDYGNFYVYEEENGEYGKRLDLLEGYSFRIVGTDEGTMDIHISDMDAENPILDGINNVAVSAQMTATLNEGTNSVSLNVDYGSDGKKEEIQLGKAYKISFVDSLDNEILGETYTDFDGCVNSLLTPTRKGYVFKGWATEPDGNVICAPDDMYSTDTTVTLYAVWEAINYGDSNGDGEINATDSVLLAQKLAGWDVDMDDAAADCNGDGVVNATDAVLLAQYLAGWSVTLG